MENPDLDPEFRSTYMDASLFDNKIALNTKEAAGFLGFSTKTVYRLIRDGIIPHKRVGGEYRFLTSELKEWLRGG